MGFQVASAKGISWREFHVSPTATVTSGIGMCVSEPIPISNARHLTSDGLDDLTRARAEGRLCPRPVDALVVFLPWDQPIKGKEG